MPHLYHRWGIEHEVIAESDTVRLEHCRRSDVYVLVRKDGGGTLDLKRADLGKLLPALVDHAQRPRAKTDE